MISLSVALLGTTWSPFTLIRCTGRSWAHSHMWLIGSPESIIVCTSVKNLLKLNEMKSTLKVRSCAAS